MKKRKCMCNDLHIFVTVQLRQDTPAVLSLGKLCTEHDYTYEWPSGREPRLTEKREADVLQNRELRSFASSRTIIEFHQQPQIFLMTQIRNVL